MTETSYMKGQLETPPPSPPTRSHDLSVSSGYGLDKSQGNGYD